HGTTSRSRRARPGEQAEGPGGPGRRGRLRSREPRRVNTITEAASVLLAAGPEVFLVARAANLRFMGGFVAFPGGKVHEDDAVLAEPARGLSAFHVAAVRELFEETGVLLARRPAGDFPTGSDELTNLRRQLLADQVSFADLLARGGLRLEAGDLAAA